MSRLLVPILNHRVCTWRRLPRRLDQNSRRAKSVARSSRPGNAGWEMGGGEDRVELTWRPSGITRKNKNFIARLALHTS
jgi:hypothetical protein